MALRVGVNGFGRIGRLFLRAVLASGADIEVVAVNDLADPQANAFLLARDSTQGPLGLPVVAEGNQLVVGEKKVEVLSERDPAAIPWGDLGVEVVVESTGRFTKRDAAAAHLKGGAKRVVVSAPVGDADATLIVGVNSDLYDPDHHVIVSNGSCTTNCIVPMVKVLDDAFGLEQGLMTTVHAYTNDQNLLDLVHKDPRRARAAAVNIVPTTTGAARATSLVLPPMKGRLDGLALRVPVADGSITDLTAILAKEVSVEEVNAAFKAASETGSLARVLDYSEDPIVSSDIVGSPASCTFDAPLTMVIPINESSTLVKVFGWYDNEWGYSNRLVDLTSIVGGVALP